MSPEKVKFLIIHSSLTSFTRKVRLADLDRAHRMVGKLTIGYHFVIGRDGLIENGRPTSMVGQHTPGQNQHSLGICMVGGLDKQGKIPEDNYTPSQYTNLRFLVDNLLTEFPNAVVVPYNHFNPAAASPCFDVEAWMKG